MSVNVDQIKPGCMYMHVGYPPSTSVMLCLCSYTHKDRQEILWLLGDEFRMCSYYMTCLGLREV